MLKSGQLQRLWPRLKPFATCILLAAVALAIGRYLANNWSVVVDHRWQLDWLWLLIAMLAMVIFLTCAASAWRRAVTWNGVVVSWVTGVWAWSRSSFARYLPTPAWVTGSRLYLTVQLGASWRAALLSYGAEIVGALAGAFGVALLALSVWVEVSLILSVLAAGVAIFVLLPLVYFLARQLLGRMNLPLKCSFMSLVGWSCLNAISFLIYGIAHVCVLRSLMVADPPLILVIGVSALAWALGTLNIFSPSGLGTREIVLIYGLQSYFHPPELLALSVLSRLAAVVGELFLFTVMYVLVAARHSPPAIFAKVQTFLQKRWR